MTITITLSETQARILRDAIDLLHRLRLGQTDEIVHVWEDRWIRDKKWSQRDAVRALCESIKSIAFPELNQNASYGVGSPQLTQDDQRMYEIYKVLDHALWLSRPDRPPHVVSGDDPYLLRYSGDPKIPLEVKP
jgi:hypothetical protein